MKLADVKLLSKKKNLLEKLIKSGKSNHLCDKMFQKFKQTKLTCKTNNLRGGWHPLDFLSVPFFNGTENRKL